MAYVDYGAILKVDGEFVNKNCGLFMDMKEAVGFTINSVNIDGHYAIIEGNFFVYAGDKEMLLCFYKGMCILISNGKFIKHLNTEFLSETFYLDDLPNVTTSKLDKTLHKDEYGDKYYSYRFITKWEHNGHRYECIYGYGIDNDKEIWNNIKGGYEYGFTKNEINIIDKWFN